MSESPLIQCALDYVNLAEAMAMAFRVKDEVEALEIGTPLCKAEGMRAVSAIHALCPGKIILADVKTPDVGGLEAKIAFDAGANWMTVMGAAPLDTLKLALEEAEGRAGHEVLVELTGIKDVLAQAKIWREVGVERMVYHRGWDEGNVSRSWDDLDRRAIAELIDMDFKISVAGGIELETLSFFQGLDISVFVIGRAIRETPDPANAARAFRSSIDEIFID